MIGEEPRLEDLGGGLYAYLQPGGWMINNTGFLVGGDGVVAVDSCSTERRTRAFLETVGKVTPAPVRTLFNTHSHPDHTAGNGWFAGATIVAHERTRSDLLAMSRVPPMTGVFEPVDAGELPPALPFLTFDDRLTLWVDDLRCEVRYVGTPAHTTNDTILWVPERSVLFAGDLLFSAGTPFLLSGSVAGAIEVLTEVVAPLGAATIVPGHGPVCGPERIETTLGYLRFVQDLARQGRQAGLSPLEAARECDLGPYAEWNESERIVGNLHRAYAEARGGEPGEGLDVPAAFRDMVAYNGGRPLTCHA